MSASRAAKIATKEIVNEKAMTPVKETEKCPRSIKRRPQSSQLFKVSKRAGTSKTKYRSDFYPENRVFLFFI